MTFGEKFCKLKLVVLAKKHRIKKEAEIKKAFFSKFQKTTNFARIILRRSPENFKLIVTVSKKVFKPAVKRNRVRRKILAIFEEQKAKNQLPNNTIIAIQVTNKSALYTRKTDLQNTILPIVSELYNTANDKKGKDTPK